FSVLEVEAAVGVEAGIRADQADCADRTAMHDVAFQRVERSGRDVDRRLGLGGRTLVTEVYDAVVVQRAVDDLPGGLQHVDGFESLHRRRVVCARIEIRGRVDRRA